MTAVFDVAIVGGGIAGASMAYRLAPHRSVVVLERESAFGYHSTGRSAAEYSRQFQNELVGLLCDGSWEFLTAPPDGFTEVPLLRHRGTVNIAPSDKAELVEAALTETRLHSPEARRLTVEEAVAMVPFLRPEWLGGALYDPLSWDMEVETLLQGFIRFARRNGAEFRTGQDVTAVTRENGCYRLETPTGPVLARKLVNAAGAWADPLAELAGLTPLGLTPMRRTAITVDVPAGIDVGALPSVNELDETFYFKPEAGKLMVSPADEHPSVACDAQPEDLDVAYAAHYLQESTTLPVQTISHKWAGLRTFAPDRRQVVGFSPQDPDFFWLAGQGGSGILTSPALSAWAASEFLTGEPPADLLALGLPRDVFRPDRLA